MREHATDKSFQAKWQAVKTTAKQKAQRKIEELTGVKVRADSLMDVQVGF